MSCPRPYYYRVISIEQNTTDEDLLIFFMEQDANYYARVENGAPEKSWFFSFEAAKEEVRLRLLGSVVQHAIGQFDMLGRYSFYRHKNFNSCGKHAKPIFVFIVRLFQKHLKDVFLIGYVTKKFWLIPGSSYSRTRLL